MNALLVIIFIFEIVVGVSSSIYLVVSLFGTLGYKFFRKLRYGISLYN
ncbi:MAG: hypothetical protein IKW28_01230 [Lachnospiraceae bacterium]|nr:hypothetical protein [Lachnospiraceae bacterium]